MMVYFFLEVKAKTKKKKMSSANAVDTVDIVVSIIIFMLESGHA